MATTGEGEPPALFFGAPVAAASLAEQRRTARGSGEEADLPSPPGQRVCRELPVVDERQRIPYCAGPSHFGSEPAGPTRPEEAPAWARPSHAGRSLSARRGR
ncbi:unnamed protein product [Prorocentrum cordatum]|uniref:Uncharacterized protein n=1 Tax=Prorocentrum cordatum TaxID=2364126 RepID=A0ABN9TTX8_9DINO|nr:unnamed protein product [Polarella glacialis]